MTGVRTGKPNGRPSVMTPEVVQKLEEAFLGGASDSQACFYAGISRGAYYAWEGEHPEFIDRKEALKEATKLRAKLNIKERIEKRDVETTKWYLERKVKEEFSTRTEMTGKDGKDLLPTPILTPLLNEPEDNKKGQQGQD